MSRLFEKVKNEIEKIALDCAAAAQAMEATMKALEDIKEEFVPDINVGDNRWIPVAERLPEHNNNVRVTVERNGQIEVAVGWYNHDKGKWKVCPNDDEEFFYYGYTVIAWKENTEEPYKPESTEKTAKRTNADRIRTMTDEELADVIMKNSCNTFSEVIPFCKNSEECSDMLDNSCDGIPESMCRECLLEWLNKPEGGVSN